MFAHSHPQHPTDPTQWEPLWSQTHGHLNKVAEHCVEFAAVTFQAMDGHGGCWLELGRLAGYWHDLGKFSDDFQGYLKRSSSQSEDAHTAEIRGRVDHTSAGAQHAVASLPLGVGTLLAYPIAGHHAGLLDGLANGACLISRLKKELPDWKAAVPPALLEPPMLPPCQLSPDPFAIAFATRMLFSCLVDADFLATESFMNPEQSAQRPSGNCNFSRFDTHLNDYIQLHFGAATGTVAEARAEVLNACLRAAEGRPGFYSLTVPTGGGKTLSSLAFALRHAACNRLRRVIYAIPFTSIIEQTAQTFRGVFADLDGEPDELILEHHSNFDPDQETVRSRLASENWDSPLIVTTNVQLFESLFANRTSRCRKLHRIAGSVIILDEVQTLPVELLTPCLKALRLLVEQYGCTVVLCTATQPALEYRPEEFEIGLPQAQPIIPDAPRLYERLKRVEVQDAGVLDRTELVQRLAACEQVLAIVSTRRHAADLYQSLVERTGGDGCYHLSAAMTPEHRSQQLEEIRAQLSQGRICRVVATQLIEAGVDVDFPVVWRSLAGLDSIAQAAGRCNREGRLERAVTWVFTPDEADHPIPRGFLRRSADAATQIMATGNYPDLLALPAIEHYFRLHYWNHNDQWDKKGIMDRFQLANDPQLPLYFDFASVAQAFQFIETTQRPVIVESDACREQVDRLRGTEAAGNPPPRDAVRKLQRHTVNVPERHWRGALTRGDLELLHGSFAVLTTPQLHYHPKLGLQLNTDAHYDPYEMII